MSLPLKCQEWEWLPPSTVNNPLHKPTWKQQVKNRNIPWDWGSQWRGSSSATKKMGLKPGNAALIPPKMPTSPAEGKKENPGTRRKSWKFYSLLFDP